MLSLYPVTFALVLLVGCSDRSAGMALPASGMAEETPEPENLNSLLSQDEPLEDAGPGLLSSRRHRVMEGRLADEEGSRKIFIISDVGPRGSWRRELRLGATRALPLLSLAPPLAPDQLRLRDQRRQVDDMSIGPRDLDIHRCMIGRVYRPCWQI